MVDCLKNEQSIHPLFVDMYDRKEEMTDSTQLLNGEKSINYFVKNAQFIYLEFKQHNMKQIGRCVLFKVRHLI